MSVDTFAVLAAVLDAPSADAPRLVFADKLEDTGTAANIARAEFIRLQVAKEGHDRQRELLAEWKAECLFAMRPDLKIPDHVPLAHVQGDWWRVSPGCEFEVTRGFISAVRFIDRLGRFYSEELARQNSDFASHTLLPFFLMHPIERVVLEYGVAETWTIIRGTSKASDAVDWWLMNPNGRDLEVPGVTRDDFATDFVARIAHRIYSIGMDIFRTEQAADVIGEGDLEEVEDD